LIVRKTAAEIDRIAAAGEILVKTLDIVERRIRPGVTTAELDETAERFIRSQGATPTFKGYRGFPASICASPNSMVVHGIPGPRKLAKGDLISVDVGVTLDGWVADAARTFAVGEIDDQARNLIEVTEASLFSAVEACQLGGRLGDISNAVQTTVEAAGLHVVRSLVGHGVGRNLHEPPEVPNHGPAGKGPRLEEGMVLAIEPMVATGTTSVFMADDGWSVFTVDDSLAAHFEFTVAVTVDGPRVLTPWHLALAEGDAGSAA
jgi:methionyl aminopeptidase